MPQYQDEDYSQFAGSMAARKIVVVTGANRGIGLAICKDILLNHSPVKLYACSRAGKDLGLKHDISNSKVTYSKLDITKEGQIHDLATSIKSSDGRVDVLINNAGLNRNDSESIEVAREIMGINYYGTLNMCQKFLPLMSKSGRIVNVSSTASSLHAYPRELQNTFRDPNLKLADVDKLAQSYLEAVQRGSLASWGNRQVYSVSKACVNAMTGILARENSGLTINCCCPGWVATDMGMLVGNAPKSPEEGARIPVKLGLDDIGDVSGKYWSNPGVFDTGYGQVMPW